MPASRFLRFGFVVFPIATAAWAAGCSSDDDNKATATSDAGVDATTPVQTGTPDAATDASDSCGTDLDAEGLFDHLKCTGLYEDFASKTVAAANVAYKPAVEFWSDGAVKSRWLYLPPNTKIDTSDMDEWSFPAGTKVWKQFELQGKLVETRLFAKGDDGRWTHTTYRWTDDQSDATRLKDGQLVPGIGPDGGTYEVPSEAACLDCHEGRTDMLLGVNAVSLGLDGATGETLAQLVSGNKLTSPPAKTTLAYPTATTAQGGAAAGPALAWLDANCGACHNENLESDANFTQVFMLTKASELLGADGGAPVTLDQLDAYKTTVCLDGHHTEADGVTVMKYVHPGVPTDSELSVLSGRRSTTPDTQQMPPLVTRAVDVTGHGLLDAWITALSQTCQ